jgi:hypothetical protein
VFERAKTFDTLGRKATVIGGSKRIKETYCGMSSESQNFEVIKDSRF